jgi:hypothetical protein
MDFYGFPAILQRDLKKLEIDFSFSHIHFQNFQNPGDAFSIFKLNFMNFADECSIFQNPIF